MAVSFRQMPQEIARKIKLIMTDVDGTLTTVRGDLSISAFKAIRRAEEKGIAVGLVSGRPICHLEALARYLGVTGPIIGENGGTAKWGVDSDLLDLGYSRQPALDALERLRSHFSADIQPSNDDRCRIVDVGLKTLCIKSSDLSASVPEVSVLDSGVMVHLVEKGVSKGKTLQKLLEEMGGGELSPENVIVFGDSTTDISLFEHFDKSVYIVNPHISMDEADAVKDAARYMSTSFCGKGFSEVVDHILMLS